MANQQRRTTYVFAGILLLFSGAAVALALSAGQDRPAPAGKGGSTAPSSPAASAPDLTRQQTWAPGTGGAPPPVDPTAAAGRNLVEVAVTAVEFHYLPPEIRVQQGDFVRLKVTSIGITHGFAIREYGINRQLPPDQEVVIEFVATRPGRFNFFCTVLCGTRHDVHRGVLVVEAADTPPAEGGS